jgi:type I restriction enzyme, S subunit
MAGEWEEMSVAELQAAGALLVEDGNHGENRPRPDEFSMEGIQFIRAADMDCGRVLFERAQRINEVARQRVRKGIGAGGDVLLSHKGTVGKVAYVPLDAPPFVCSPQTTFWRVKDPKRLDRRYIYFYLLSRAFREQLDSRKGETDMADYVSLTTQRTLKVTVPPLAKQKAIAAVLGALDDKIELNRRMNATLESMARALFQSWFVDFDPVRAKLDGREPFGLDPGSAALFPEHLEDSPLGKKPIGWEVNTLESVLSVLETGGRPKGGIAGIMSGVPSIGAESIVSVGVFDFGKTKYVPIEFYESMKKGRIKSHDVLLYKDGGRPGEYEPHVSMFGDGFPFEQCSINEHVYRLRSNDRLSQEYLYFWMTSEFAFAEMRIKGTGVAIPGLNSTAVRSLAVLIPPQAIVEAFTKQAAPLVTRILSNSKQSRILSTLRGTLLPKLMSGELSVAAAKETMEMAR